MICVIKLNNQWPISFVFRQPWAILVNHSTWNAADVSWFVNNFRCTTDVAAKLKKKTNNLMKVYYYLPCHGHNRPKALDEYYHPYANSDTRTKSFIITTRWWLEQSVDGSFRFSGWCATGAHRSSLSCPAIFFSSLLPAWPSWWRSRRWIFPGRVFISLSLRTSSRWSSSSSSLLKTAVAQSSRKRRRENICQITRPALLVEKMPKVEQQITRPNSSRNISLYKINI